MTPPRENPETLIKNLRASTEAALVRARVAEQRVRELEKIITANKTPCPDHGVTPSICEKCIDDWLYEKMY